MSLIKSLYFVFTVALSGSAFAADTIYPPGSRIGLVPPPGLESTNQPFFGFADRNNNVAISLSALPAGAYDQVEKSTTDGSLEAQGLVINKREDLNLPAGKAVLLTAHQSNGSAGVHKWMMLLSTPELTVIVTAQVPDEATKLYPDDAVVSAIESVSLRESVPADEQFSMLPFKIDDLAGFQLAGISPGRAAILSDGGVTKPGEKTEARVIVAIVPASPEEPQREEFAREVFAGVPTVKDVRLTGSEPLRIGSQFGHQIMAVGKDAASGDDVTIVQWLRFGGGASIQIIGIARTDEWMQAYGRFRQVRDSVETR